MSRYSPEEKRRILEEARATLEQLDEQDRQQSLGPEPDDWLAWREGGVSPIAPDPSAWTNAGGALPTLPSTAMNRYRQEAAEAEARRAKAREADARQERERHMQRTADWNEWLRAGVAAALEETPLTRRQIEILGMMVAQERERMREHVAEQIGLLRAEMNMQRSIDEGTVIDLPKGSWKTRHVA
jgi:hypothetical protein